MNPLEIGVCTWSVDRADPAGAIDIAARRLSVRAVQVAVFGRSALDRFNAESVVSATDRHDVHIAALFVGFDDVDTSSPARAAETGGLAHPEFGAARVSLLLDATRLARALGVHVLAAHIGPVPSSESLQELTADRLAPVLDELAALGGSLILETGAEPAEALLGFIDAVGHPALGVNFDPANFLGHDSDDPVRAVSTLAGRIQQVHLKDADRTNASPTRWPEPRSLGAGDVNVPRVVSKLRAKGYDGPLFVERAGGHGGIDAVASDVEYLRSMLV